MRKSYLFAAAGAAVILCGCSTPITQPKPVIPAPPDDPVSVEPGVATTPGNAGWDAPKTQNAPDKTAVSTPEFEPLTGAVSSGGIESDGKKGSRKGAKYGKSAAVSGNVYVVQSGDTPERIARKLRVRLSALMAVNNLDQQSARRLQIGQKLTIPDKNAKVVKNSGSSRKKSSSASSAGTATVGADGKYTVQSGDTPERIARKLRVRLSELLKANNLDQQSARRLQIGQKLTIPGKNVETGSTQAEQPEVIPPVVPPTTGTDTAVTTDPGTAADPVAVVKNAPVSGVADTTDTAAAGADDSNIKVVVIEEDTTLEALSAKLNIPANVIKEKNSDRSEFKKGDLVIVPNK